MKKILLLLIFSAVGAFAQIEKIETHEPARVNVVEVDGQLLASAEIFADFVEVAFMDNGRTKKTTFGLTLPEFKQVGDILTGSAKDKDFYMVQISDGRLFIRFSESYGYVQSTVYLEHKNKISYLPKFNRHQFGRLFKI